MERRVRERALLAPGVDGTPRGCELVGLEVRDICHGDQVAPALPLPAAPATVQWRASVIVDGQQVDGIDAGHTTQGLVRSDRNAT